MSRLRRHQRSYPMNGRISIRCPMYSTMICPPPGWEGVNGYGEGESILLTFDTAQALHGIRICGGYRKNAATYQENGRVTSYRLEFSDGTVMDVNMGDYPSDGMLGKAPAGVMGWETVLSTDGREWQGWDSLKSGMDYISFGKAVTTDYVRLTILAVAPERCMRTHVLQRLRFINDSRKH